MAQTSRTFPLVGVTTNVTSWLEQTALISAQVSPVRWLGVCVGFSYRPQQENLGKFLTASQSFEIQGEARLFPWGAPRQVFQKDTRPAYWKKPKTGCKENGCFGAPASRGIQKLLAGLYIAPGFSFHQQDAVFIPMAELHSPIPEFRYRIVNQGPCLSTGYQLRFHRLTLGIGTRIKFSQPHWEGPQSVFSDDIYSITFPTRIRIEEHFLMEVGYYF